MADKEGGIPAIRHLGLLPATRNDLPGQSYGLRFSFDTPSVRPPELRRSPPPIVGRGTI